MEAKNTIRLFYFLSTVASFGLSFVFATYVIFLRENGMNYLETNMVNFAFLATVFLFEVPTGAVADVFGRKISFVVSCVLMGVSFIVYALSTTFWGFVLGETICAIGVTFCSGAYEAWMVDRLKFLKHDTKLAPILSRRVQFDAAAYIAGASLGAWISDMDLVLPWIIGGIIQFVVALAAAILMKEEGFERQAFNLKEGLCAMKKTVRVSIEHGRKNKKIRFIFLAVALMQMTLAGPNLQWQPFFKRFLGDSLVPLGLIFAGISVAIILGAALTDRTMKLLKQEKRAMCLAQLGVGVLIAITGYMTSFTVALVVYLLHELIRGIYRPIKDAYMHENIPSSERATLVSFESMTRQIGGMLGLVGSGLLAEYVSIPFTWAMSGLLLFVATLWLMKNGKVRE